VVRALILFDVDGTLVDMAGAGRRALTFAIESVFGLDGIAEHARRVRFQGKTDPVILAEIAAEAGIPRRDIEARTAELCAAYVRGLRRELERPDPRRRALPGVPELLEHLDRREGVFLGLLTGNLEEGARAKLGVFDLNRFFPDGGFASDHPDRNEIARLARFKLSRRFGMDFHPREVTVVGDTELDVACARANGYRAVAVDSGWVPREDLVEAEPDALLDSLTDLSAVLRALRLA
jgi:phosphoglycolate phosphatase-like HAD superfamily hydrolase